MKQPKKATETLEHMKCSVCDNCTVNIELSRAVGRRVCIYGGPFTLKFMEKMNDTSI